MDIVSIKIRKTGGSVARPPRPHLAEDKSTRNYDFVTETAYAATATISSLSFAFSDLARYGGTMPDADICLYHACRSYFAPIVPPCLSREVPRDHLYAGPIGEIGGGAGYCPRVHYAYSAAPSSAIVDCSTKYI